MVAKRDDEVERADLDLDLEAQLREALRGEAPPGATADPRIVTLLQGFFERAQASSALDEDEAAARGPTLDFALLRGSVGAAELAEVFRGFAQGLAPSAQLLERMLGIDLVFGAWARVQHGLRRLAGVVHARRVRTGQSLGASDLIERDGESAPALFTPPRAWRDCVVCHHAVTHPDFKRLHITQALILDRVLPHLRDDAQMRDLPWLTSSPMTDFIAAGRGLLAHGPAASRFDQLLRMCDEHLGRALPGPRGSLRGLIALSRPYLREEGYPAPLVDPACEDPGAFFARLYQTMPTHGELVQGADREEAAARVARLYAPERGGDGRLAVGRREAFTLFYLAAAFTQLAYDGESGEPQDPVRKFHLRNGAALHPGLGPLPGSRTQDVAALRFGQIFIYTRRWMEEQQAYRRLIAERRCAGGRGALIDLTAAASYLGNLMERVVALTAT